MYTHHITPVLIMAHIHFLPLPLSHVLPRCRRSGWQISAHRRDPGENMAVKWEDDHKPLDVESLTLSNSSIRHGTQTYTNYIHAYDCIICKWTSNIYMHINQKKQQHVSTNNDGDFNSSGADQHTIQLLTLGRPR